MIINYKFEFAKIGQSEDNFLIIKGLTYTNKSRGNSNFQRLNLNSRNWSLLLSNIN